MKPHEIDVVLAAVRAEIAPLEARVNAAELRLATAEAGLAAAAAAASKGLPAVVQRSSGMTQERAESIADKMIEGVRGYFRRSVNPLVERVAAIEKRGSFEYRGVWQSGTLYDVGDFVTQGGSLWACRAATDSKPGDGSSSWTLAVKRGADAPIRVGGN